MCIMLVILSYITPEKKKIGFDLCLNDEIKHMDSIVSNFTQCLKIITYLLLKICLCLGIFERQKKTPKNSSTRWQQMALKLKLKIELLKKIFVCFFSSIPVSLSVCCNISVWWCCHCFLQCKMCTVALI